MNTALTRSITRTSPIFRLLWQLVLPLRLYLRYFPIQRGKGILLRGIISPLLPEAPTSFATTLAGGGRILFQYRETLGWSTLLYGAFEDAELRYVGRLVQPGDTVFDIGANVGLFSVVLGCAVGTAGRVIAAEPIPANADRAKENFALNDLKNVQIVRSAMGVTAGTICINLSDDPAYPSVGEVAEGRSNGRSIDVDVRRLDDIWKEIGSPKVRFVKIDVEGAEADVLMGAMALLADSQPVLLLEANDVPSLNRLREIIEPMGYRFTKPEGFVAHNYLAIHSDAKEAWVS